MAAMTYRVMGRIATVRWRAKAGSTIIAQLAHRETVTGREVVGRVGPYTALWVKRDAGGYVLRAMVEPVSESAERRDAANNAPLLGTPLSV